MSTGQVTGQNCGGEVASPLPPTPPRSILPVPFLRVLFVRLPDRLQASAALIIFYGSIWGKSLS
ncbi:MAG: hypothetical protein LBF22_00600 [Deltaproteobacteria bacterium]|nr:hypothetical protein [Deltaproteobacteria bacterium]